MVGCSTVPMHLCVFVYTSLLLFLDHMHLECRNSPSGWRNCNITMFVQHMPLRFASFDHPIVILSKKM